MPFHKIVPSPPTAIKVRQSRKQIMVYSILPKNERWDNFQYINCFRDLLTFTTERMGANLMPLQKF